MTEFKLPRYRWDQDIPDDIYGVMVGPSPEGEWVRWSDARQAVQEAVEAERERCAKLCEELPSKDPEGPWFNHDMSAGALECAAAIRSGA
jgi:hypothetical protein